MREVSFPETFVQTPDLSFRMCEGLAGAPKFSEEYQETESKGQLNGSARDLLVLSSPILHGSGPTFPNKAR